MTKETEDFEDFSSCFGPLEDRWNSLSFSAQKILKKAAVEPAQPFPRSKVDNQCPYIAKFEGSAVWQEVFWKGFVKIRCREISWRSPVHQAFVITQLQTDIDISKSRLTRDSLLERVEILKGTLKGPMNTRILNECVEELVILSVYFDNIELVSLLEMILARKPREVILMELENVVLKSQKRWIRELGKLKTVTPVAFKKLLVESIVSKSSLDMQESVRCNDITSPKVMDYQDFQVLVTEDCKIRASSDQGNELEQFNLDTNEIELTLELIEENRTNKKLLKGLGDKLYKAIFPSSILNLFSATKAAAEAIDESVRLRLTFDSPKYESLPWEFLYDERTNTFLANNIQTVLSRYIDVPLKRKDIKAATLPLKILVVISSPLNLTQLDTSGEETLIQEALQKHIDAERIELDFLHEATRSNITQKLREKAYNIFHFIGHGTFERDQGFIELVDQNGNATPLSDEAFANFFLGNRNLGLVVLNSCQGASASSNRAFAGVAPNLVQRGIPAVVAMRYSIYDTTAKLFADEFYRTLALGWPVDAAIQTTRNAISMDVGLDRPDFATPVLYMRAKDGIITDL